MKWKGKDRLVILRELSAESDLPSRYVSAACDTVAELPIGVTFGVQ